MGNTKATYATANKYITSEELKTLEVLLCKLKQEIGASYCIIPEYLQDGYFIGLYHPEKGDLQEKHNVPDIQTFLQARKSRK